MWSHTWSKVRNHTHTQVLSYVYYCYTTLLLLRCNYYTATLVVLPTFDTLLSSSWPLETRTWYSWLQPKRKPRSLLWNQIKAGKGINKSNSSKVKELSYLGSLTLTCLKAAQAHSQTSNTTCHIHLLVHVTYLGVNGRSSCVCFTLDGYIAATLFAYGNVLHWCIWTLLASVSSAIDEHHRDVVF